MYVLASMTVWSVSVAVFDYLPLYMAKTFALS